MDWRPVVAGFVVVLAAGCGSPDGETAHSPESVSPPARDAAEAGAPGFWSAPGYFPAVDKPSFGTAVGTGAPGDSDRVLGVVYGGEAHAYPLQIIAFHHAVNDVFGRTPVLVSYCEVCSSGTAFVRALDGRTLHFEFEGAYRGVLTLRDRETGSSWVHLTGECVRGPLVGRRLSTIASARVTSWREWRGRHPGSTYLRADPRVAKDYHSASLSTEGSDYVPPMLVPTLGKPDPRLPPNDLLYGVTVGDAHRGYPIRDLATAGGVFDDEVAGTPVTVWLDRGAEAVVAFDRRVGGRTLSFSEDALGRIRDRKTNSEWTLDGLAVSGPLTGSRLRPVQGVRAEWYGWSALLPTADLRRPSLPR